LHIEGCRVVKMPSVTYTRSQLEKVGPPLVEEIRCLRRVPGMELYLANQQRWLESQFVYPTTTDVWRVKRIAKYIVSHRAVTGYVRHTKQEKLKAVVDTDWAGDPVSRRSTSGGMVLWRQRLIALRNRTERAIAVPSSESEYYSLTTGCGGCCTLAKC
jgi:hypothetical protein